MPETAINPEKTNKNYFGKETEDAILDFQAEPSAEIRKKIFVDRIKPAFDKLVENIVNVYHFHSIGNIETLRYDCVSMLFENLYKFDGAKGHKAFSYFNVIAKNWFIQRGKVFKKRSKLDVHFDKDVLNFLEKNSDKVIVQPHEEVLLGEEFYELLKEDLRTWDMKFGKPQEQRVLEAVMHLLENPDSPAIYNKKGIYLYIREMTNLNTKQIVTNLAKFRKKYNVFKKKYEAGKV
jgi:hypothetical protein